MFHGGIGNVDIEKIFIKEGFHPIIFPHLYDFSLKAKAGRWFFLLKLLFSLPLKATVYFQFPLYARMHKMLALALAFRPFTKVVCFIVDINGLKSADRHLLSKEISELRRFRYFIVHNAAMARWLEKQVPLAKYSLLHFFDFLASPFKGQRKKSPDIVFAGNLAKSGFVSKLDEVINHSPGLHFHIYGPDPAQDISDHHGVTYKGVCDPYDLPQKLEGSFGLVWDGEGIDGPGGSFGYYMEDITHHKVSLYILAKTPIIIYENAGAAELVKSYGIGIIISSLLDIENRIAAISEEQYTLMCRNMEILAEKISSGSQLQQAIYQVERM